MDTYIESKIIPAINYGAVLQLQSTGRIGGHEAPEASHVSPGYAATRNATIMMAGVAPIQGSKIEIQNLAQPGCEVKGQVV